MNIEILRKLEGIKTIEMIMEEVGLTKQSALNLVSKLKKEQHLTYFSKKRPPLYYITVRKQRPRKPGMFDIINKHSPHFQINPWFDHQVHGPYGPEEALIDAIQTKNIRVILASTRLFNHITDWHKLFTLSKKYNSWQKIGALYDVARLFFRVRRIPSRYRNANYKKWRRLLERKYKTTYEPFKPIAQRWKVHIPYTKADMRDIQW